MLNLTVHSESRNYGGNAITLEGVGGQFVWTLDGVGQKLNISSKHIDRYLLYNTQCCRV